MPQPHQSIQDDGPTDAPGDDYRRALGLIDVGRLADARSLLEGLAGDDAAIELALLDVLQKVDIEDALERADAIAARATDDGAAARALHVAGLAAAHARRMDTAADRLIEAIERSRRAGDTLRCAQARDTLGSLEASRGRIDLALRHYTLALVEKQRAGDRAGEAITLGNLGRLYLRCGWLDDAMECFERDLEIARELGDRRGEARMLEDLGRTHLELGELDTADALLQIAEEVAVAAGLHDVAAFARLDAARVAAARGNFDDASARLARARASTPEPAPYLAALANAAAARIALDAGDPLQAAVTLEQSMPAIASLHAPDVELPARIDLARALVELERDLDAEAVLLRGAAIARRDGYARYLPAINEAMTGLRLVEGAIFDEGRSLVEPDTPAPTGAYLVRAHLGSGAFGEVFRVYDPYRGRDLAYKRVALHRITDLDGRSRVERTVRRELEIAARVRHPGVARVHAIGAEPGGALYIVQDFIDGGSLAERSAPSDVAGALEMLATIADALGALHDAGVVHRDLKPANIIMHPSRGPILVDFGIAHLFDGEPTAPIDVAGTPRYMAPEQRSRGVIDGRTDLYALGATAVEWLTQSMPRAPSSAALVKGHAETSGGLEQLRDTLSPAAYTLLGSLMAPDPDDRPSNATVVARQLRSVAPELRRPGSNDTTL